MMRDPLNSLSQAHRDPAKVVIYFENERRKFL